jgi:hypothetical protein
MLIPSQYNQKGIFEKVIRARDGRLMRLYFEVYEINGEIKGRLIKAEPVLVLASAKNSRPTPTYRLSGKIGVASEIGQLILCAPAEIVSPYFWNIEKKISSPYSSFCFLTSIKIRAPEILQNS